MNNPNSRNAIKNSGAIQTTGNAPKNISDVGIEGSSFQKAGGDPIMAKRTAKFMAHQNK